MPMRYNHFHNFRFEALLVVRLPPVLGEKPVISNTCTISETEAALALVINIDFPVHQIDQPFLFKVKMMTAI